MNGTNHCTVQIMFCANASCGNKVKTIDIYLIRAGYG